MSYAELTREDPNRIKRWLQRRRIAKAVSLVPASARRVVDYGAGDADVAARLVETRDELEAIGFEPAPELLAQARVRTTGLERIRLVADEAELPDGWADVVLCLEVFEHLPEVETCAALGAIHRVLRPGGLLIVGVPLEIGPVALPKGLFRRARRVDAYDADWDRIFRAAAGRAPGDRPQAEIAQGRAYHYFHLGFDHRRLLDTLGGRFAVTAQTGTPFGRWLGLMNTELYISAVRT